MKYESLSYPELRELVRDRKLDVPGDSRTKKNLVRALTLADEQAALAEREAAKKDEEHEPETALEKQLASKVPGPTQRMVFGRDYTVSRNVVNEQLKVGNLPADYVHGWASMNVGEGEDLGRWTAKGWIRVTTDMVSSDPNVDSKIYVKNFEDWNGYVKHKDTLLMIAHRRLVEDRKQGYTDHWNAKVEKMYGKRGSLTRDRVGDPSETSGRSYKRTAQWKAEDLLEGGGS